MQKTRIDILTPRVREVNGHERDVFDSRWRRVLNLATTTATVKKFYNRRNRMHAKAALRNYDDGQPVADNAADMPDRELRRSVEFAKAVDYANPTNTDTSQWALRRRLENEARQRGGFEDLVCGYTWSKHGWEPCNA